MAACSLVVAEDLEGPPHARRGEDAQVVVHHDGCVIGDTQGVHGGGEALGRLAVGSWTWALVKTQSKAVVRLQSKHVNYRLLSRLSRICAHDRCKPRAFAFPSSSTLQRFHHLPMVLAQQAQPRSLALHAAPTSTCHHPPPRAITRPLLLTPGRLQSLPGVSWAAPGPFSTPQKAARLPHPVPSLTCSLGSMCGRPRAVAGSVAMPSMSKKRAPGMRLALKSCAHYHRHTCTHSTHTFVRSTHTAYGYAPHSGYMNASRHGPRC